MSNLLDRDYYEATIIRQLDEQLTSDKTYEEIAEYAVKQAWDAPMRELFMEIADEVTILCPECQELCNDTDAKESHHHNALLCTECWMGHEGLLG